MPEKSGIDEVASAPPRPPDVVTGAYNVSEPATDAAPCALVSVGASTCPQTDDAAVARIKKESSVSDACPAPFKIGQDSRSPNAEESHSCVDFADARPPRAGSLPLYSQDSGSIQLAAQGCTLHQAPVDSKGAGRSLIGPLIRLAAHKFLKRSEEHRTQCRPPHSVANDPSAT